MNLRHFHQAAEEARLMDWDWWALDRAPVDSPTGIRRLLEYARIHQLVLNQAHLRIAVKHRANTEGVKFFEPIPVGDNWAWDMFISAPVGVITESPPCEMWAGSWPGPSFTFGDGVIVIDGEERGRAMNIRLEMAPSEGRDRLRDLVPEEAMTTLGQAMTGRLIAKDLQKLAAPAAEPEGHRYGPYDADPHTKGRRRRFRPQRKA